MPEPDLALLNPRADFYTRVHPVPADVLLAVEVSDTTLAFDVKRKAPLYARCGVPEVWIVDVNAKAIRVFRELGEDGYGLAFTVSGGESVQCQAFPAVRVVPQEIFPK
jgi:Uma2 family endonuclease